MAVAAMKQARLLVNNPRPVEEFGCARYLQEGLVIQKKLPSRRSDYHVFHSIGTPWVDKGI